MKQRLIDNLHRAGVPTEDSQLLAHVIYTRIGEDDLTADDIARARMEKIVDGITATIKAKKKWRYTVSTNTIWASFDGGIVEADDMKEAYALAKTQLDYDFSKVNDALDHCYTTKGFTVNYDPQDISIELMKDND